MLMVSWKSEALNYMERLNCAARVMLVSDLDYTMVLLFCFLFFGCKTVFLLDNYLLFGSLHMLF